MALATFVGLFLAILRWKNAPLVGSLSDAYVAIIRNTPELVQFYFLFYALPRYGILLPPFGAAVVVLGLHYGAFLAEVFRGGVASIPRGQLEAAHVLDMHSWVGWYKVILPQVVRRVLPPWGNYVLIVFKASALASVITVHELTFVARDIAARNFQFLEVYTVVIVIYFIINYPTSLAVRLIEKRLSGGAAHA
jgi:polar amino acid transport system permease protein